MSKVKSLALITALSASALATSPVPTSSTLPSTPPTLGSAAAPQSPTVVDLEIRRLQPTSGEKFDLSEIRQGMLELLALEKEVERNQQVQEKKAAYYALVKKEYKLNQSAIQQARSELKAVTKEVRSNQQTQEKKAALKAAIVRDIKKDPKNVIRMVLGVTDTGYYQYEAIKLFIQSDPDLAIALLDHVPAGGGLASMLDFIGKSWAESDLKAALAWANQQTDSEIKDAILEGISRIMRQEDPEGLLAFAQSLPPGVSQDRLIKDAWWYFSGPAFVRGDFQGLLARMHALPEGRTKDLAASGISLGIAERDLNAAVDIASRIGDTGIRTQALEKVGVYANPAAAAQSMQSLPVGPTRDSATKGISRRMSMTDPQAGMEIASKISDTGVRTQAEAAAAWSWYRKDPAAAIQWLQSLPVGPTKDSAARGVSQSMAENAPQAAMNMATGIGDSNLRTEAQEKIVNNWFWKDPAAATQWINHSSLPQEGKAQLLAKAQRLRETPLPRPIIVPPSDSR